MEETWRIIIDEGIPSGTASPTTGLPSTEATSARAREGAAVQEEKAKKPIWADVGKFVGGLVGIVGIIAFVFQMIRRSRIFTTFMDSFLTVLSAFVDIIMIPFIPIFSYILRFLVKLLPFAFEVQQKIAEFLKDPVKGIRELFDKIGEGIIWLGKKVGNIFTSEKITDFFKKLGLEGLGSKLSSLFGAVAGDIGEFFKNIGIILSDSFGKILDIWGTRGLSTWDKIKETAEVIFNETFPALFADFITTATDLWDDIKPYAKDAWDWVVKKFEELVLTPAIQWINDRVLTPVKQGLMKDIHYFIYDYLPAVWGWFIGDWLPVEFHNILVGLPGKIADLFKSLPGLIWDIITGKEPEKPEEPFPTPDFPYVPGGQFGIPSVPKTGLYLLHSGEQVVPANQRYNYDNRRSMNVTNVFNITADSNILSRKIANELSTELRYSFVRV